MKKIILFCLLFFVTVGGFADNKKDEFVHLFYLPSFFGYISGRRPDFQTVKPEDGLGEYYNLTTEARTPILVKEKFTINASVAGNAFIENGPTKTEPGGGVSLSFGVGINHNILNSTFSSMDGINFTLYPVYNWYFYNARKITYYKWKCAANLGYLYTTKLGIAIYPYCQSILGFTPDGVKGCVDLGLSVGVHFGDL